MNIEVKVSLDKTASELLQEHINAVAGLALNIGKLAAAGSSTQPTATKKAEPEEPKEKADEPVAEGPPPITIEQVREAFLAKNSSTNKPKLKAILNKFGVKKVTDLKEDVFPAVLKALEEI